MKRKLLKCVAVSGILTLFTASSVSANTLTITGETDLTQNPAAVSVTAEILSYYTVSIPKDMTLEKDENGKYVCEYEIDITGNIDEFEYLSVVPQSEVVLSTEGKDDVIITVTQPVTKFRDGTYTGDLSSVTDTVKIDNTDAACEANGMLTVKDGYRLSSGQWSGTLVFDISLTDEMATP